MEQPRVSQRVAAGVDDVDPAAVTERVPAHPGSDEIDVPA
jgi:hypothetical protein